MEALRLEEYCDKRLSDSFFASPHEWEYILPPQGKTSLFISIEDMSEKNDASNESKANDIKWPRFDMECEEATENRVASPSLSTRERLAVELYAEEMVSQEIAARIAGLSRSQFLETLSRSGVSPFQYTADELHEDLMRAKRRRMGRQL